MDIKEMYAKRATAWEAAKKFLDTHTMEDGTMSAEDGANYDKMEADINNLTASIEREERRMEMEKKLSQPTSRPITDKPGAGVDNAPLTGRASHQYAVDFLAAMRSNFHQVSDVLEEGNDANGGYLVPAEWDKRLIDKLDEENIFRGLATTITTSGEHKINIAATKPAAAWIEEGEALTFGDATFDQIMMDAHKLHVAIKITEELLYDNAFNLEGYIINQFGRALGNAEEDAFLNGDGQGKPLPHPGQLIEMTDKGTLTSWSQTFHTYGLRVDRQWTTYYLDDAEVWRHPTNSVTMEHSHVILLNYAIGGASGWPVDLERYGNASDMYVDYLRVFEGE